MQHIDATRDEHLFRQAHGRLFEAESVLSITQAALIEGVSLRPEQIETALSIALRRLEDVHKTLDSF